jgi:hypothetical protein
MSPLSLADVQRILPELKLPPTLPDRYLDPDVIKRLEAKGVNPDGFSLQAAKVLLAHLKERRAHKLCTLQQAAALAKFEVSNPGQFLFKDVDDQLAQARKKMLPVRIEKYLQKCAPAISGQYGHNTTFFVALSLVRGFCLSQEQALPFLHQYNQRCEPPWNEQELKYKLASAASFKPRKRHFPEPGYLLDGDEIPLSAQTAPTPRGVRQQKTRYEAEYLKEFTSQLPDCVDTEYLEIRSQFTCWNRSPAGFLHKAFRKGESVWVTIKGSSRDGLIWTHDGAVQNLAELDHLKSDHSGVWFLSNPIDGTPHKADRLISEFNLEGLSFRCAECVTDWRHCVVETDCAPADLWLKALALLEVPIVAIYHSGGRGSHALVNLGASSVGQWHALLEPHREHLIRLGACPSTLTPLRLSRLPNCKREETGRLQALLYLSPDADGTPIANRALREDPLAAWIRYLEAARFGPSDNI